MLLQLPLLLHSGLYITSITVITVARPVCYYNYRYYCRAACMLLQLPFLLSSGLYITPTTVITVERSVYYSNYRFYSRAAYILLQLPSSSDYCPRLQHHWTQKILSIKLLR